ncbi:MAG: hypothetical protein ACLFRY_06355 [Spirochaetia bacterium]
MKQPRTVLTAGRKVLPPKPCILRAGPVSLSYAEGAVRYLTAGEKECIRGIYSALRDRNWETVEGRIENEIIDQRGDDFSVSFDSIHKEGNIEFSWKGSITGDASGTVTFTMDGIAHSTFERNRIGFCVLHPMDLAGHRCVVTHSDGKITEGFFPGYVSPHQPFCDISRIHCEVEEGLECETEFSGEIFEMEDQRNWTDASFKTYCTPLGLPFPVTVEEGTEVHQAVTVRIFGTAGGFTSAADDSSLKRTPVEISIDTETSSPLPDLGLSKASHGGELSPEEIDRLKRLCLQHYRIEITSASKDHRALEKFLTLTTREAGHMGTGLEAALFLGSKPEEEMQALVRAVKKVKPPVVRWLVFKEGEKTAAREWVELFRGYMAGVTPEAVIASGTDAFFTELNRERPDTDILDGVTFSLNPQVHAFDNESLVETLPAQYSVVETVRDFSGPDTRITVSPVTFKMRWNPNATGPEPPVPEGELPRRVDLRQLSLFGAAWTLGSISSLARAGADSVTYFETTGWLGVMETESGSPLPEKFPSKPGQVFPLYFPFAWLAGAGRKIRPCSSSRELEADGFVLERGKEKELYLMNYLNKPISINFTGLEGPGEMKVLDETTVRTACMDPEGFLESTGNRIELSEEGTTIDLRENAIARIALQQ